MRRSCDQCGAEIQQEFGGPVERYPWLSVTGTNGVRERKDFCNLACLTAFYGPSQAVAVETRN